MIILGIDTSFDDTAAAIVKDTTILSNVLSTDLATHQDYGGVVPRLAREGHEKHINSVIELALKRAHITWEEIEAIAVTRGPGLSICLEIGIAKAKDLAIKYSKPLIAVNHLEGHLLSFLLEPKTIHKQHELSDFFPALGIIISGGNTQFVYAPKIGTYEIVGETRDDAMGECFDKVGRMLGLGYPAGKVVEVLAKTGIPGKVIFPVPMRQIKSADMSFSGLKTAAMRIIEKYPTLSKQDISDIALGFQVAVTQHLLEKLDFAIQNREVKSIVVGGGVICNMFVRKQLRKFAKKQSVPIYFPYTKKLCTDNGAMIALVAQYKESISQENLDRLPIFRLDQK
ncbi:MAG: tRNA (adenosine(37)-N6)-threonylcarbamoyltransferase complex transferase subunit TsaD [Candidatus Woesebacteria bacterium]